jgi:hypothetical protein
MMLIANCIICGMGDTIRPYPIRFHPIHGNWQMADVGTRTRQHGHGLSGSWAHGKADDVCIVMAPKDARLFFQDERADLEKRGRRQTFFSR